jgi:hypothetical protein
MLVNTQPIILFPKIIFYIYRRARRPAGLYFTTELPTDFTTAFTTGVPAGLQACCPEEVNFMLPLLYY